ncbi:MAG: hypothetical protein ABSG73_09765 [Candidatus Aminicenantales bacterium]
MRCPAWFQNELKLTRKIAHRNVCRMFDLGKDGPAQFIMMEYFPGEDLKNTIRRIGPLTTNSFDQGFAAGLGGPPCHQRSFQPGGQGHRPAAPAGLRVRDEPSRSGRPPAGTGSATSWGAAGIGTFLLRRDAAGLGKKEKIVFPDSLFGD